MLASQSQATREVGGGFEARATGWGWPVAGGAGRAGRGGVGDGSVGGRNGPAGDRQVLLGWVLARRGRSALDLTGVRAGRRGRGLEGQRDRRIYGREIAEEGASAPFGGPASVEHEPGSPRLGRGRLQREAPIPTREQSNNSMDCGVVSRNQE